ncbi:MAG: Jag N-terminal domain-containing protein [Chloroflexi bacterium]|nr:Jag N-terminal domain-containing protein [Chloroflexota bacterium]
MESLEIKAKTVEEAIHLALEQLGVSREEVEVIVVKEGRSGIMGFGAEEAVVRVQPLVPAPGNQSDVAEAARSILERLLTLMGLTASVESQSQSVVEEGEEASAIALDVKGDDLGILIGRRGQTLAGLQYIVRLIVGHQTKNWVPIVIDVEGYKQRRYQALQVFARNLAEQVKAKGTPFTMEPMPAYERRIIHLTLADHPDVTTESIDEGDFRKVMIIPRQ